MLSPCSSLSISHELTSLETSVSQPIFKTPGVNHIPSVEVLHVSSHCVLEAKTHRGLVDLPMPDPDILLPQAESPNHRHCPHPS